MTCKTMKTVIEKIVAARGLLSNFNAGEFHIRIVNDPYMPLSIERHGNSISVTHYFENSGDLVPDPDMEFVVGADGNWYPVAIQYSLGIYRRARWSEDGKNYVSPREAKAQTSFSNSWARNIQQQGFITAGLTKSTQGN